MCAVWMNGQYTDRAQISSKIVIYSCLRVGTLSLILAAHEGGK